MTLRLSPCPAIGGFLPLLYCPWLGDGGPPSVMYSFFVLVINIIHGNSIAGPNMGAIAEKDVFNAQDHTRRASVFV